MSGKPLKIVARTSPEMREQALAEGAVAFVEKPFPVAELRRVIDEALASRGPRRPER